MIFLAAIVMAACTGTPPKASDVAAQSAKAYYEYLLHDDYKSFVAGTYYKDSIPIAYRRALETNARQYWNKLREQHGGISAITVNSSSFDTKDSTAHVFLVMHYSNGSSSQVLVPMVCRHGVWYMR